MGNFIYVSIYIQISDTPAHGHSLWHGNIIFLRSLDHTLLSYSRLATFNEAELSLTGPDGAVVISPANGLAGSGFVSHPIHPLLSH